MYSTTRIKKMMAKIGAIEDSGEVDILTAKLKDADIKITELEAILLTQKVRIDTLESDVSKLTTAEVTK